MVEFIRKRIFPLVLDTVFIGYDNTVLQGVKAEIREHSRFAVMKS